jgi:hypothetical protein
MNTIVSRPVVRSLGIALHAKGPRVWARIWSVLRRLAALYAQGRIRQAAIEVERFEQCHRRLAELEDVARPRPR